MTISESGEERSRESAEGDDDAVGAAWREAVRRQQAFNNSVEGQAQAPKKDAENISDEEAAEWFKNLNRREQ